MKKKLLIATIILPLPFFSQVGVNTTNPQGTFHVDGAKNNPSSGAPSVVQQSDDFVITNSGNIGVGTAFPSAKVEIASGSPGVSGLRFNNLNSLSPTTQSGKSLSVDVTGNVILSVPVAKASDLGLFSSNTNTSTGILTSSYPIFTTTFYDSESADTSNSFNPSTGIYIVPSSGYYYFQGVVTFDNTTGGLSAFQDIGLRLYQNSSSFALQFMNGGGNSWLMSISVSAVIFCSTGDQITLRHTAQGAGFQYKLAGRNLFGWKISNL